MKNKKNYTVVIPSKQTTYYYFSIEAESEQEAIDIAEEQAFCDIQPYKEIPGEDFEQGFPEINK